MFTVTGSDDNCFAKDLKECLPSFKYFRWNKATGVLSLGILFLVLQLLYMIITVTNEFLYPTFSIRLSL